MPTSLQTDRHDSRLVPRILAKDQEQLGSYIERLETYRRDCGCTMGGLFLVAALAYLVMKSLRTGNFFANHSPIDALRGTVVLFAAAVVGKLTGIGIARLRFVLLYRYLRRSTP
jgi:hypothetical protein